jgi:hypothetical protein
VPHRVLFLGLVLLACRPAGDAAPPNGRHVVPHGLVHVSFRGIDAVAAEVLPLHEAVTLRAAVLTAYETTHRDPDHRAWFFHAFDRSTLVFFVARWQPLAHGGIYTAERRIVVRRDARTESALEVADIIAQYEHGSGNLRAGMTPEEVERRRGKPPQVQQLGPVGSFDYLYPDLCARFLDNRVAHLWPRTSCTGP